jgi:ABC-type multidrug transport system fused ATPase/permease subunit
LIYALDKGQILECGTHEELMQKRGTYYNLVIAQEAGHKKRQKQQFK